jgi:O-acetyl-ADP-ribose deacetylase
MPFEKIIILKGDITEVDVEAIVNAANTELWMGTGVAGAILKKGGRSIEDEAVKLGPIHLGDAVITRGGTLKAAHVIHAAVIRPGESASVDSIRKATISALEIVVDRKIRTVAFPALGTGVGALSYGHCARAMLSETIQFLQEEEFPKYVYFVLREDEAHKTFKETLEGLKK